MKRLAFLYICIAAVLLQSCDILKQQLSAAYNRNISLAPFDVVIVPGAPFDSGRISPLYKARLLWAKSLYESGITGNIIFSGAATHTPYVEAQTMKLLSDALGIPAEHTFVESRALHSVENVAYGIELAHQLGFKKIAIATDPFQNYYLQHHQNSFRFPLVLLPFSLSDMPLYLKETLPNVCFTAARVDNFVPLEKREMALK